MTVCNAKAKGDKRKDFMKGCLAGLRSQNSAIALKALSEEGRNLFVCHIPFRQPQGSVCLTIAVLSDFQSHKAVEIAEWLRWDMTQFADNASRALERNTVLNLYTAGGRVAGCSGIGVDHGVDVLARNDLTNLQQYLDVETFGAKCRGSPQGVLSQRMGEAFSEITDIVAFLDAYSRHDDSCGSQFSARPMSARQFVQSLGADSSVGGDIRSAVEKLWAIIADSIGGLPLSGDPTSAIGGSRGYCFVDTACATSTCGRTAMTRAFADLMHRRYGNSGCIQEAIPNPDSPSACYQIRRGKEVTPEMRAQLLKEGCEMRAALYGVGIKSECSGLTEWPKPPRGTCDDPGAMCSPEQEKALPRKLTPTPQPR